MNKQVASRAGNKCELCGAAHDLTTLLVAPKTGNSADDFAYVCGTCASQMDEEELDEIHWRCLNDAMWSEVEAVKVIAYRLLQKLKSNGAVWASDLSEMMYLESETEQWAKAGMQNADVKHIDSNGVELQTGDSVTLIKDLKVKGGGFTAKRGTAVRNIRLVPDNAEQIEGKVDGQHIVILTQYVLKR